MEQGGEGHVQVGGRRRCGRGMCKAGNGGDRQAPSHSPPPSFGRSPATQCFHFTPVCAAKKGTEGTEAAKPKAKGWRPFGFINPIQGDQCFSVF